jgi:hypothetical protein
VPLRALTFPSGLYLYVGAHFPPPATSSRRSNRSIWSPFAGSSLISLANVVFNVLCRGLLPLSQLGVVIITLSAISTFIYGAAALITSLREHHRFEQERRENRHLFPGDGALITDDEMQRQQLLKLLHRRPDAAPNPKLLRETYHIDIPGNMNPQKDRGQSAFPVVDSHDQQITYSASSSSYRDQST